MPPAPQEVHRVNGEKDGEIEFGLVLCYGDPEIQFPGSADHVLQHLVDGVLVLTGPTRDFSPHFTAKAIEKTRCARLPPIAKSWLNYLTAQT